MNTDRHGLDLEAGEITHEIIGAAFEIVNKLGHGLKEKPYENALVVECGLRDLAYSQQSVFDIDYKGVTVGTYIPDLIIENTVIVDTKVIDRITDHERGQMMNYLRISGLRVGLILNFKHAKLQWDRVIV